MVFFSIVSEQIQPHSVKNVRERSFWNKKCHNTIGGMHCLFHIAKFARFGVKINEFLYFRIEYGQF